MIFSRDLLFVHVPKTGGMSVTHHLLQVLPRPIFYAHPTADQQITDPGIVQIPGTRHESLEQARGVIRDHGFDVSDLPMIMATLRNPYSLEVSRYAYLQKGHQVDRGYNQILALTEDFENFSIKSLGHTGSSDGIEEYFLLDGAMPPNLSIVRYEHLAHDLEKALGRIGIEARLELPWVNKSHHGDYRSYYTRAAEEAVYRRYRWVFDNGFYTRINPAELPESAPPHVHRLPIVGPVRQVGPSSGFWPDLWVGKNLSFLVKAEEPTHQLLIDGSLPKALDGRVRLSCAINGNQAAAFSPRGDRFEWTVPCDIARGITAQIDIDASATWSPQTAGVSQDMRHLCFQMNLVVISTSASGASGTTVAASSVAAGDRKP